MKEMFKKSDLKNGMVIELNSGIRRLVWEDRLINECGFIPLQNYDDNLNNINELSKEENIDKVFLTRDVSYLEDFFSDKKIIEIWRRV